MTRRQMALWWAVALLLALPFGFLVGMAQAWVGAW